MKNINLGQQIRFLGKKRLKEKWKILHDRREVCKTLCIIQLNGFIYLFFFPVYNIDNSIKYFYAHRIFTPLFFFPNAYCWCNESAMGPCRPSAITIGFSHLVFLHNVRRITGRFPATPEDDRSASSRKIRRKKKKKKNGRKSRHCRLSFRRGESRGWLFAKSGVIFARRHALRCEGEFFNGRVWACVKKIILELWVWKYGWL